MKAIKKTQRSYTIGMFGLLSLIIFYGCKKSSSNTLTTTATAINLKFEQKYIVSIGTPSPPYALPGADTIVFHENNTITESSGSQNTTYGVAYIAQQNALATVYANGSALIVALTSASIISNGFPVFNGALGTDTTIIATYENGTIATNNTPTLGCEIYTGSTGSIPNYEYLWLIAQ